MCVRQCVRACDYVVVLIDCHFAGSSRRGVGEWPAFEHVTAMDVMQTEQVCISCHDCIYTIAADLRCIYMFVCMCRLVDMAMQSLWSVFCGAGFYD